MKSNKLDTAIILISEITKGMKSIGSKALLNIVDNITILDHQIHYIKKYYNPEKIILCTGFDHDRIVIATKKYKNIQYWHNNNYINENQAGSLIGCIKNININNALIITNGVILFNKIKLGNNSSTYFIKNDHKKNTFEIGTSTISSDGYLFYDLENKWIEMLYLNNYDINKIKKLSQNNKLTQLFLFEWINKLRNTNSIDFIKIDNINAFKINSIKDISYAKKIYKKYSSILC
jgi:choline kinase